MTAVAEPRRRTGAPRPEKVAAVEEVGKRLAGAKCLVLADMTAVGTKENLELRESFRKEGITFRVYKNTILARAFDAARITCPEEFLAGSTAVAFGKDEVSAAKVLWTFAKKNAKEKGVPNETRPRVKGGLGLGPDGNWRVLPTAEVAALAALPSREEVFAKLLGLLNAPTRRILGILQAPSGSTIRLLEAQRKSLER